MRLFRVRPMSDAEAAKWAAIRDRGRRRYILMSGVVGVAVPTAILSTSVNHFFLDGPGSFLGRLALSLVLSPLGGIYYGKYMWSAGERRYTAWRQQRP